MRPSAAGIARLLVLAIASAALAGPAEAKPRRKPRAKPAPSKPAPPPAEPEAPAEPDPAAAPSAPASPAAGEAAADREPPDAGASRPDAAPDVDGLRAQYLALRDQLFRSRARAATVASALYSSRLRIHLDHASARHVTINRATIRLDGASVFDDAQGTIGQDKAARWDGFVAPGRHVITVRIEATGKDDQRFTTSLESSFVVQAVGGKDLVVTCTARDTGDMAYAWQRSEKGSYKLGLDVAVQTQGRDAQASR
jgi:hypothetical protein